jgi:tetratricopeptide (TPR) repeat protein
MRSTRFISLGVLFGALSLAGWSQTAQVRGTVTDSGTPVANATLVFTNLGNARTFKVKSDKSGAFALLGVPYGDYDVEVSSASGEKLYKQKNSVAPSDGGPVVMKIDISQGKPTGAQNGAAPSAQRPAYTKEQIAELQKKNEQAKSTNVLIQQVNTAMAAKNWQDAIAPLEQLIAQYPNNWQYQNGLGEAELNVGQYEQSVESFQKGIQLVESITTADPNNPATDPEKRKVGEAKMLTNLGNAYLKLHKNKEAVDAYTKAAGLDPNPGTAYFNLCATQYNTGNVEGALQACDKAIAADPSKADAYFIKGSLLIASSTADKDGKVQALPGTAEALKKYLELQPQGPHAEDAKQMLQYIGSKVETTYKKKDK